MLKEEDTKEIKELLAENKKLLEAIHQNTEKTRRYIFWSRLMTFVYLLIFIVLPLALAIIYLPPFLQRAFAPYQELLGNPTNKQDLLQIFQKEVLNNKGN